jgi:hypothetical protein
VEAIEAEILSHKPLDPEDLQRGRWGTSLSHGRRASGEIVKDHGDGWLDLRLRVQKVKGPPLVAPVYSYLHDTFDPMRLQGVVSADGNEATVEISSYGAFIYGVLADQGRT